LWIDHGFLFSVTIYSETWHVSANSFARGLAYCNRQGKTQIYFIPGAILPKEGWIAPGIYQIE
jgi:hypothetical protein